VGDIHPSDRDWNPLEHRSENVASVRVLAKAAFQRVRFIPELKRDEYRVSAAEWWRGDE
jgi:RimJ/RimL family protein N-acetyltransferase